MNKEKRSLLVLAVLTVFVGVVVFLPGPIGAGNLEPPGPPGSTMHTLEEIYNKLEQLVPSGGAPVETTGQTTCYDDLGAGIVCEGTGQDGEIKAGIVWLYPRFTDNLDGTVTDNLTNLIWLKDADRFGLRGWSEALDDCNLLADDGFGLTDGSVAGDWRLPNVKELLSLIDYSHYDLALPSDNPFDNVQNIDTYWSSTSLETYASMAWVVFMKSGYVTYAGKSTGAKYVWPVRGGN